MCEQNFIPFFQFHIFGKLFFAFSWFRLSVRVCPIKIGETIFFVFNRTTASPGLGNLITNVFSHIPSFEMESISQCYRWFAQAITKFHEQFIDNSLFVYCCASYVRKINCYDKWSRREWFKLGFGELHIIVTWSVYCWTQTDTRHVFNGIYLVLFLVVAAGAAAVAATVESINMRLMNEKHKQFPDRSEWACARQT